MRRVAGDRLGVACALGAGTLFGTIGTARALGAPDVDAAALGALRLVLAGPLLVLVVYLMRGRGFRSAFQWPILVGALGVVGYQITFLSAIRLTGVAVGTVIAIGSAPTFTGLLARVFMGERPGRRWAVATGVAVAGCGLITLGGADGAAVDPRGVALALACGVSTAFLTLGGRAVMERGAGSDHVMAVEFSIAAVLLAPALVLRDTSGLYVTDGLLTVGYLVVVPTVAAYLLLGRALALLQGAIVATLIILEPVVATILGLLVLGERPPPIAYAGMALVFAGLALLAAAPSPPPVEA